MKSKTLIVIVVCLVAAIAIIVSLSNPPKGPDKVNSASLKDLIIERNIGNYEFKSSSYDDLSLDFKDSAVDYSFQGLYSNKKIAKANSFSFDERATILHFGSEKNASDAFGKIENVTDEFGESLKAAWVSGNFLVAVSGYEKGFPEEIVKAYSEKLRPSGQIKRF